MPHCVGEPRVGAALSRRVGAALRRRAESWYTHLMRQLLGCCLVHAHASSFILFAICCFLRAMLAKFLS